MDLQAALDFLVERARRSTSSRSSEPARRRARLDYARKTGVRLKAFVLLSPGREAPVPAKESIQEVTPRPILVLATEDEAAKGASCSRRRSAPSSCSFADRLASGATMFGRVPAVESTIADWLDRSLAQPSAIEIPESKLVFIDGEVAPDEARGATMLKVPLGDGSAATIRITQRGKRLLFGFDVPEPYVRLNEVVIYVDGSGKGGRSIEKYCWRISFNPKNAARKPLLVQRGGLKGFEDTDDKGVITFARTEEKRRWTAEVSLDFSRFLPGDCRRRSGSRSRSTASASATSATSPTTRRSRPRRAPGPS